ncbi:MAG: hypothetical protein JWP25_5398 [Bradyrhizobium sp.]|nr:hypothetical protein [Bradyrhizobium sp.]
MSEAIKGLSSGLSWNVRTLTANHMASTPMKIMVIRNHDLNFDRTGGWVIDPLVMVQPLDH